LSSQRLLPSTRKMRVWRVTWSSARGTQVDLFRIFSGLFWNVPRYLLATREGLLIEFPLKLKWNMRYHRILWPWAVSNPRPHSSHCRANPAPDRRHSEHS
jgi:hypothetical protein